MTKLSNSGGLEGGRVGIVGNNEAQFALVQFDDDLVLRRPAVLIVDGLQQINEAAVVPARHRTAMMNSSVRPRPSGWHHTRSGLAL